MTPYLPNNPGGATGNGLYSSAWIPVHVLIGLMLLIATILLGVNMQVLTAPLLLGWLIGANLLTGYPRMPRLRTFFALVWLIPFVLWWRYGMDAQAVSGRFMQKTFLFFMGFYTLSLGIHQLLARKTGGNMDYALACGVLALGMAGAGQHALFFPMTCVFALLMLLYLRGELVQRRGPRTRGWTWLRYVLPMAAMVGAAYLIQVFMVPRVPDAGTWLVNRLAPSAGRSSAGHDRTSKLGELPEGYGQGEEGREVMLRVFGEKIDPYLRGAVFSDYGRHERGEWTISPQSRELDSKSTHLGRSLYNTQPAGSGEVVAVVYADSSVAESYFLPLATHEIGSLAWKSWADESQCIRPEGRGAAGGYAIYKPVVDVERLYPATESDLRLKREIEWWAYPIAMRVMPGDMPTQEKLHALQLWFTENFEYRIGVNLADVKDPLLEFLEDTRAGHCEFFASAGVVLLRAAGVPARYVTGFLVEEPGAGGDFYVARRKHAHAWVEVYLEDRGWITYDPTPASGRPDTAIATSGFSRTWEWVVAQGERFRQLIVTGGIFSVGWETLVNLPQQIPLWLWVILISIGSGWIFRDNLRSWLRPEKPTPVSPHVRHLREQLAYAEKMLHRYGLVRGPGMTVGAYLHAVRTTPDLPQPLRATAQSLLERYVRERFRRE